ncbi:hypothetical protein HELRODRAFT_76714 [Helobdella robusta]|uniref:DNA replication complex GINS protein PSF2 n=1 Tax=Helobdella robusta TaxID=6412 RepID=T1G2N2_HELRO|nr:hypothetical protein HELRODRAFT_76714 [Helobdella robusta]ESO07225.1 hypothetical protein HELRODRAFT_76714 [Helobdella robusta]
MNPAEIEFIAEKELVSIVPNFALDKLYLISGDVGPLNPGLPVEVPLWVAVMLKQRQKCRIIPPTWMDVEILQQKKQEEIDSKFFTEMPSKHYMEVSQLMLKYASENLTRADEVRTLVKDIWDIRSSKLRSSVDAFIRSDATHAKLNHLTLMELNTIRPLLTKSLELMQQLRNSTAKQIDSATVESQSI